MTNFNDLRAKLVDPDQPCTCGGASCRLSKQDQRHGTTYAMYYRYGCRCEPCSAAAKEYWDARNVKKRKAKAEIKLAEIWEDMKAQGLGPDDDTLAAWADQSQPQAPVEAKVD